MLGFERRRTLNDLLNLNLVGLEGELDAVQLDRLKNIRRRWNFYEGYHWEELPKNDQSEVTLNYCRAFVDKFVAFELGKSFSYTLGKANDAVVTNDGRTQFQFLEDVWEDNNQYKFSNEMGITKSVTGEAWVQVKYFDPEEMKDPYGEYPDGRLRIILSPTGVIFPEFDPHDKDVLVKLTVMYQYEKTIKTPILGRKIKKTVTFKTIWTDEEIMIEDDGEIDVYPNKYKTIPFIQIKNLAVPGREFGRSDLEDLIPVNIEYNMKKSDVSEIIDYHSAPITVVYGAKIGNLENGANKMWGGLAKDARVENLQMQGDLLAANTYTDSLKKGMCEISGLPEQALGGAQAISNTSGVALQYMNMPLVEKTRIKRNLTEDGLERLNKLILLVALTEGLITKPDNISPRDFFHNEVSLPDTLPKDMLLELQQIQMEFTLGLEDRKGAMKRLGREDIDKRLIEIDKSRAENPDIYTPAIVAAQAKLNSGFTNGETPVEVVRKEITGKNGG